MFVTGELALTDTQALQRSGRVQAKPSARGSCPSVLPNCYAN